MINPSSGIEKILEKCRQEAIRHNNASIDPRHLLLALISDSESQEFKLIEKTSHNVSAHELYRGLDDEMFDLSAPTPARLEVTDLTQRIVKLSALEARLLRHPEIEPVHVLLAVFHNHEVQQMEFMKPFTNAGVDYRRLHALVADTETPELPRAGADYVDDDDDDDERPASASSDQQRKGQKGKSDTPMLDKFGHDMTRAASEGRLDPVVGREVEIERLAQVLSRRKKNNPDRKSVV